MGPKKIIRVDPAFSGQKNMALDLAHFQEAGQLTPDSFLIRIYEWDKPTISLGLSQNETVLNTGFCRERGVEWVPRLTGGKAVLHDRELTYSVAAPAQSLFFGKNLYDAYRKIGSILQGFLNDLGTPADLVQNKNASSSSAICYAMTSIYEIEVNGKKLVGSAQKRGPTAFLQHGSIPVFIRPDAIRDYLAAPDPSEVSALCLKDLIPESLLKDGLEPLKERLAGSFRDALMVD